MSHSQDRIVTIVWCFLWGVFSTTWCWSAAHALGVTYDEPFYIQAGLKNWHHLYHRELLTQGTMPLPVEVQTLPLLLAESLFGADVHDLVTWLPIARMMTILFWWLLLWASYHLAAQYGGPWAGRLAVALVACEPLLLGHASLATTDVAFSACLLTLIVSFRSRREEPTWQRRLILPTVWCAICILSKASALVFVPICLLMVELERLFKSNCGFRKLADSLREFATLRWDAVSWSIMRASLRDLMVIGLAGSVLVFIVCPRASRGLLFQIRHNLGGHGNVFLLGEVSPNGFWYYFPVALAIKLGLPILILLVVLLLVRPRALLNGVMWATLVMLAVTPMFRVQIGVRYVMPLVPLAITAAAAAFASWWHDQTARWQKALIAGFAGVLLCWSMLSAWSDWPHGICHTNELWGGSGQGYRLLTDSNHDWGQGLTDLIAWQHRHPDKPLRVCYWGTDPRIGQPTFKSFSLPPPQEAASIHRGYWLAVSTNYLASGSFAEHFRDRRPDDRTMTFLIYDFTRPQTARMD